MLRIFLAALAALLNSCCVDASPAYISYLVGPLGTGSPASSAVTEVHSYATEISMMTIAVGILSNGTDITARIQCNIGGSVAEAPITSAYSNNTLYTVCSAVVGGMQSKALLRLEPPMKQFELIGWTSAFQGQTIQYLATDYGRSFYFISKPDSVFILNTTLWFISPETDMVMITNTSTDGYIISNINIFFGQLYGLGTMLTSGARVILTWPAGQPTVQSRPTILPGFPSVPASSGLLTSFTMTSPSVLWSILRPSAVSGGASVLQIYSFNAGQRQWLISGQYNFNVSYAVPNSITRPSALLPPAFFHGTSASQLLEYNVPPVSAGGNRGSIQGRILVSAPLGKTYRGAMMLAWIPTATTSSSASGSGSATSSGSATVSALPTAEATGTANFVGSRASTATAAATVSATATTYLRTTPPPTQSSTASASGSFLPLNTTNTTTTTTATATATTAANTTYPASAAQTNQEAVAIGVGITVPLIIIGLGAAAVYMLMKSGKLFMIIKGRPSWTRKKVRPSPKPSPIGPRAIHIKNPALEMNINPNMLKQLQENRHTSVRAAEERNLFDTYSTSRSPAVAARKVFTPMKIDVSTGSAVVSNPVINIDSLASVTSVINHPATSPRLPEEPVGFGGSRV